MEGLPRYGLRFRRYAMRKTPTSSERCIMCEGQVSTWEKYGEVLRTGHGASVSSHLVVYSPGEAATH